MEECYMKSWIKYFLLLFVLLMLNVLRAERIRLFSQLQIEDKKEVVSKVANCVTNRNFYLGAMVCSIVQKQYGAWDNLSISEESFIKMVRVHGLQPTSISWIISNRELKFKNDFLKDVSFVYLNEEKTEDFFANQMKSRTLIKSEGVDKYNPYIRADEKMIISFLRQIKKPLYNEITYALIYEDQYKNHLSDLGCSNMWMNSVYALVPKTTFNVDYKVLPISLPNSISGRSREWIEDTRKITKRLGRATSSITLTKKETTELIYVTALRRGIVKSLKEFNEKYVGKNIEFIVELTNPKCETEFGIMLYKASAK